MRYRLHQIMALLSTTVMFFLFSNVMTAQSCGDCDESVQQLFTMGSTVRLDPGVCMATARIDPDGATTTGGAGEHFPDLAVVASSNDPSCFAPGVTISTVTIQQVLVNAVSVGVSFSIAGLVPGDIVTVDFDAELSNGLCSDQVYSLRVEDDTDPVIDCPADITVNCPTEVAGILVPLVTFTDLCVGGGTPQPATYIGQSALPDQCTGGNVTRTWTATDPTGNTAVCVQNIVVVADATSPTAGTLANLGQFCNIAAVTPTYTGIGGLEFGTGLDITDCTPDFLLTFAGPNDVLISGTDCQIAPLVYQRTYTLTDACGNSQAYTHTFEISDTQAPTITTQPTGFTNTCNTGTTNTFANWLATAGGAAATDNCGGGLAVTVTPPPILNSPCPNGDYTVQFVYTDDCGNTAITNPATYTIMDNTAPGVGGGTPEVVECASGNYINDFNTWMANAGGTTGSDECSGPPVITYEVGGSPMTLAEIQALLIADVNDGLCMDNVSAPGHPSAFIDDVLGFVELSFVYTDLCNNLPSASQDLRFLVTDGIGPVITVQASDSGVNCAAGTTDASLTAWLTTAGGAMATDDCGGVTWSAEIVSGGLAPGTQIVSNSMVTYGGAIQDIISNPIVGCGSGTVTMQFTATDECGNTSGTTTNAIFTITDNVGPAITSFPQSYQVDCTGINPATVLANWLSSGGDALNIAGPGAVVSDDCSTMNTYYFLSGTYNINADPDMNPGNEPNVNMVSIADLSNGCGPTGFLQVEWFFVDACLNFTTSGPITFSIIDVDAPTPTAPSDMMVECDGNGNTAALNAWLLSNGGATATDNCSGVNWSNNFTALTSGCLNTGNATVTFVATDDCGNSASAGSATFTINDTAAPFYTTAASNMSVNCEDGTAAADLAAWLANHAGAVASDACTGSGSILSTYVYIETSKFNLDADGDPTNDVDLNNVQLSDFFVDNMCNNTNSVSVNFFAIDGCGNIAPATTGTFDVFDNTAPMITQQPSDLQANCNMTMTEITNAYNAWILANGGATATDGCNNMLTWTANEGPTLPGSCGGETMRSVSFTAADDCGNAVTTNTVLFEVKDFTIPNIPGATSVTEECGPGGTFGNLGQTIVSDQLGLNDWIDLNGYMDPTAISDNCSEPIFHEFSWVDVSSNTGGTGTANYYPTIDPDICNWSVTVTFSVFDQCNREATSQASFTIFDNVPPSFTAGTLPDVNIAASNDAACTIDISGIALPAVSDNCTTGSGALIGTGSGSLIISFVDGPAVTVPCDPTTHVYEEITRTWTVADACGLTTNLNQTIGKTDWNPPRVVYPMNVTVDCSIDVSDPANTGGGILGQTDNLPVNNATNNADCNDVTIVWNDGPLVCVTGSGTFIRTWEVSDACGNSLPPYNQSITVTDNTPPTIVIQADDVDWSCGGDGTFCGFTTDPSVAFDCWIETVGYHANATDNCSMITNIPIGNTGVYGPPTGSGAQIGTSSWSAYMSPTQPGGGTFAPFTTLAFLPAAACPADRQAMVDFVVTDDCGNTAVTTATWSISDDNAPVLTDCPTDVTISTSNNGTGDCSADLTFAPPIVVDNCADTQAPCGPISFTAVNGTVAGSTITMQGANDPNVIISALTINFSVPGPPTAATSGVILDLDFFNLDGEFINIGHTEFFFVMGEDGSMLGQTGPTATQCGDLMDQQYTIPAATFNTWALDGIVQITLQPNNPGAGLENQAINNTCGGTTVEPSLAYNCSTPPAGASLTYTVDHDCDGSADIGPIPALYPTITQTFYGPSSGSGSILSGSGSSIGTSCVTFTATDCSGNTTVCSFNITVEDDEPPVINDCPTASLPASIPTTDCQEVCITLPRPSNVTDNCQIMDFNQDIPFNSMSFTAHPNITGFILDTTIVNFDLTGSPPPSGDATVSIDFKGDIDGTVPGTTPEEMLNIFLGGTLIGTTGPGAHCAPTLANIGTFNVPLATLLTYYNTTGSIDITVAPVFNSLTGFGSDGDANNDDFGINPCVASGTFADDTSITNVTDGGNTMMNVSISFEASAFTYCIDTQFPQFDVTNMAYPTDGSDPEICLPPGMNTIKIKAMDSAGNIDSTSCVTTVEIVAPSLGAAVISTPQANLNCPGDLVVLDETTGYTGTNPNWNWYQDNAPAGQGAEDLLIGTTTTNQLVFPGIAGANDYYVIITDNLCVSMPSASLTITVNQDPVAPVIFASPNPICEGESFGLFIGNPMATWLSYSWTGPNGYTSNLQQPAAITNATTFNSGTYELCVIDFNGCEVCGTIDVVVGMQPETPVIASNSPVCDGDPIILTSSTVCANYIWIGPDGDSPATLLNPLLQTNVGMTTIPEGDVAYDAGIWTVICENASGCTAESAQIDVVISPPLAVAPSATPTPACEGQDVQLSAGTIPNAVSFAWSGPGSYASTAQNPILQNVNSIDNAGTYTLMVTDANGCTGIGTVEVDISGGVNITAVSYSPGPGTCVTGADDLQFMVSEFPMDPSCYTYAWTGPNGFASITKNAIIPNVTSAANGSYILVITDCNGCESDPFEVVVDLSDMPATPVLNVDNNTVCEGESVTFSTTGYTGSVVVYNWTTPGTPVTTMAPSLTLPAASIIQSGLYSVSVTVDGCDSNVSDEILLTVTPQPTQPVVSGPAVVCEGESLELTTDFVMGATYEWSGPGFTSAVQNPVIFPTTVANSGTYSVIVSINGCESVPSDPLLVTVSEAPNAPSIVSDGPTCIDDANAALTLSVTAGTAIPGATYEWFNTVNGSLGTSGIATSFTLSDFSSYGPGDWSFYVIADVNGCSSGQSVPVTVTFDQIPVGINADAGVDIFICDGTNTTLQGIQPTVGIGTWTQVGGAPASIANANDPNTSVSGLSAGSYIFSWTLSNGACADYSSDNMNLIVNASDCIANAGGPYEVCEADETNLAAEAPCNPASTGRWAQSSTQEQSGVSIADVNDPNTLITGLEAGNVYTFDWIISNEGCGDYSTSTTTVIVSNNNNQAYAGVDESQCGDEVMLDAANPADCTGAWSSADPNVSFVNAGSPSTIVLGLSPGENVLTWTITCGSCPANSDDVIITYEAEPDANNDVVNIPFGQPATIDVLENDNIPDGGVTVNIVEQPSAGTITETSSGMFLYEPSSTFAPRDQFTYEICSNACPDVCVEAIVGVAVQISDACSPPTIFTPNGDNYNDEFVIPCIYEVAKYPDNELVIFGIWGDEVYRAQPYLNDWMGTYNGADLPVGSYYYILDLKDGSAPVSGFLVLER